MIDTDVQTELLKQFDQLPLPKQRRVLDFARSLTESPQGVPGTELLQFAGIMTPEEAKDFLNGIKEECKRIDLNEW